MPHWVHYINIFYSCSVLVHSGRCDNTLYAEWLRNSRKVLLTVLEARSPRSGSQHDQVLVRALLGLQTAKFSWHPYVVGGAQGSVGLYRRVPVPFMRASTPPKGPTS